MACAHVWPLDHLVFGTRKTGAHLFGACALGATEQTGSNSLHLRPRKYWIYEEDRKKRYNETPKKSEARQIYEPEPTFDPLCHIYQESWHQKKKMLIV